MQNSIPDGQLNSITKIIIIYCQHVNIVTKIINITLLQSLKRTTANSILPGISVGNHYPAGTVVRFYPMQIATYAHYTLSAANLFLKPMILMVTITKALTITTVTMKTMTNNGVPGGNSWKLWNNAGAPLAFRCSTPFHYLLIIRLSLTNSISIGIRQLWCPSCILVPHDDIRSIHTRA